MNNLNSRYKLNNIVPSFEITTTQPINRKQQHDEEDRLEELIANDPSSNTTRITYAVPKNTNNKQIVEKNQQFIETPFVETHHTWKEHHPNETPFKYQQNNNSINEQTVENYPQVQTYYTEQGQTESYEEYQKEQINDFNPKQTTNKHEEYQKEQIHDLNPKKTINKYEASLMEEPIFSKDNVLISTYLDDLNILKKNQNIIEENMEKTLNLNTKQQIQQYVELLIQQKLKEMNFSNVYGFQNNINHLKDSNEKKLTKKNGKKRVALFLDFDKTFIPENSAGMPITNNTKKLNASYHGAIIKAFKSIETRLLLSKNIEFVGIYIITRAITSEVRQYLKQQNLFFNESNKFLVRGIYGACSEKDMFPLSRIQINKYMIQSDGYINVKKDETLHFDSNPRNKYVTYDQKWAYVKSFMVYDLIRTLDLDCVLYDDDNNLNIDMVKRIKKVTIMGISNNIKNAPGLFSNNVLLYNTFIKWVDAIDGSQIENNQSYTVSDIFK